jgi:hypothetical protein
VPDQWSRPGGSVSGGERRFHLGEQHRPFGPVAQAATARRGAWRQGPPVARRVTAAQGPPRAGRKRLTRPRRDDGRLLQGLDEANSKRQQNDAPPRLGNTLTPSATATNSPPRWPTGVPGSCPCHPYPAGPPCPSRARTGRQRRPGALVLARRAHRGLPRAFRRRARRHPPSADRWRSLLRMERSREDGRNDPAKHRAATGSSVVWVSSSRQRDPPTPLRLVGGSVRHIMGITQSSLCSGRDNVRVARQRSIGAPPPFGADDVL